MTIRPTYQVNSRSDTIFAEPLKTTFTPEDLGFGIWKSHREVRDSVAFVNRMRARKKKTLRQVVAELEKWQFR
ncbi:MAG: hypothetical protein HY782_04390 [Chloroflexi bacterium]|nr:hypothetical protein [Chloroflexota bacterium]